MAYSFATWPVILATLVGTVNLSRLAAQEDPAPLIAPIPEVETAVEPPASPTQTARAKPPRAVSDWDLYTGSVYANTSPLWVQAEYLLWWLRGNEIPPLATTSPAGTPRDEAGVWGAPATQLLFGSERVDNQARGGFRTAVGIRLGHWFDALMDCELQADYLWLGDGQSSGDFWADSNDFAILARPFFNTESGQQDALLVSYPGVAAGGLHMETSSDFRAAGVAVRRAWLRGERGRIEWLAGYRYLRLQEEWTAHAALTVTDPSGPVPVGSTFDLFDSVETWNEFHGGDLGLQWWTQAGGWTVEVVTKVAIGGLASTTSIRGLTVAQSPDDDAVLQPGGLLALPTNMGRYRTGRLAGAPELSLKLRRPISSQLILTAGYSLLVVDRVMRTGDQLDLMINTTQIGGGDLVGAPRPAARMNDSTLWLHGFTIGLEW